MIIEDASIRRDTADEADYVIVGTGAAGAVAAATLAEGGASVILIEEGPHVEASQLGRGTVAAFTGLFRDFGAQVTRGPVQIPCLQAAVVGGSTVINSGIMWRTPEWVLDSWEHDYGLAGALDRAELDRCWTRIEADLSIRPTAEDRIGGNGNVLRRGAEKLGWAHKPTHRSEKDCEGSGRCLEGCTKGRRQSMNHSYLPRARQAGARIYTGCRVETVAHAGAVATGVHGRFKSGFRLSAHARKAVLVGASAIHTPALLQRSGLDTTGHVGRHFQGHPGVALAGLFDEPVKIWEGATQSYEVTEFRRRGIKIESLSLPPEMLAVRLPGVGGSLMELLGSLDRVALAAVPIKAKARGTVRQGPLGVAIQYTPEPGDVELALEGLSRLAEIYLAAGARFVLPGVHGLPERYDDADQLGSLRAAKVGPEAFSWVMTHLMGTARMGPDPRTSACDPWGRVHHTENLHVLDSSLFPTNLGVNPQHTIMGLSMRIARHLLGA